MPALAHSDSCSSGLQTSTGGDALWSVDPTVCQQLHNLCNAAAHRQMGTVCSECVPLRGSVCFCDRSNYLPIPPLQKYPLLSAFKLSSWINFSCLTSDHLHCPSSRERKKWRRWFILFSPVYFFCKRYICDRERFSQHVTIYLLTIKQNAIPNTKLCF